MSGVRRPAPAIHRRGQAPSAAAPRTDGESSASHAAKESLGKSEESLEARRARLLRAAVDRRRAHDAAAGAGPVASTPESGLSEGAEAERRAEIRRRLLAKREKIDVQAVTRPSGEAAPTPAAAAESRKPDPPDESSDSDEVSSTSSSSSSSFSSSSFKPMFVSKAAREAKSLKSPEELRAEELEAEARLKEEAEAARRSESLRTLRRVIQEEAAAELAEADAKEGSSEIKRPPNMPSDEDGLDEAEEFEAWKAREFERLQREEDLYLKDRMVL